MFERPATVFESIRLLGHDEDWEPSIDESGFEPTDTLPGTKERVEVMRLRVERGCPVFHSGDRLTFDGSEPERSPRGSLGTIKPKPFRVDEVIDEAQILTGKVY